MREYRGKRIDLTAGIRIDTYYEIERTRKYARVYCRKIYNGTL